MKLRPGVLAALAVSLLAPAVWAQDQDQHEGAVHAAFRLEGDDIKKTCSGEGKSIIGCASTFVTDHPLHVAFGTIAPQNGVGIGPALVWHVTAGTGPTPAKRETTQWLWSGSVDAVTAPGGAWRVGAYASVVPVHERLLGVVPAGSTPPRRRASDVGPVIHPVISMYSQSISLPHLLFFGIGPDTAQTDKSFYGERENVTGGNVVWPISNSPFALFGEVNGRWVTIRSGPAGDSPSIEQRYSNATAPGLFAQPGFVQFGEGVRFSPAFGHLGLRYAATYQQYQAPSDSLSSFQRWMVDLNHEIAIYHSAVGAPPPSNTPNECAAPIPSGSVSNTRRSCPPATLSRDRTGTITLRAFMSRSVVSGGAAVPFYFQQTIGGSDLDGNRVLPSYEDYRFRGPHLVLFQETFEHSLFGSPIGLWLSADQGKVSQQQVGLDFANLAHSWAVGFSLRAGGMPVGLITWATGPEGHHFAITISPTLFGASSRPALQ